jgi:CRP/FNR family transcriptional regulator, cyclic AMP receptor protein
MKEAREIKGDELQRALARFAIFADLKPETLALLGSAGRLRKWAAGTHLFQRGDEGDHMIALTEGRVRLSFGTANGRELVLRHLTAGDILGELALIDGLPRSADAVVITEVTGIVIGRAAFQRLAQERADLALALARHLSEMLRSTNFQMESIALYDLQMRVIRFFLHSLREVHGDDMPDQAVIRTGLNQTDLSAILGASRPKVNRALQNLIASGAIQREGDKVICNVASLQSLADEDWSGDPA